MERKAGYQSSLTHDLRTIFLVTALSLIFVSPAWAFESDVAQASEEQNAAVRLAKIWDRSSHSQAVTLFQRAADRWEELNEPRNAVSCLIEAAKLTQTSEYQLTEQLLTKALRLGQPAELRSERIISLSLMSLRSLESGNRSVAKRTSREAGELSAGGGSAASYAHFAEGMYEYYYGTIRTALDHFELAEGFSSDSDDVWLRSHVLLYAGFAKLRDAQPIEAEAKINAARIYSESVGFQKGRALASAGLAYVYHSTSEKQKALDMFQKAEALLPPDFEWIERGRIRSLVGEIYLEHRYLDLAQANFQQAISYFETAGYDFGKAGSLRYLAQVYLARHETTSARATFEESRRIAERLKDDFLLADISEGVGNVELSLGNYDRAIDSYLDAVATYRSVGVNISGVEVLLGEAYEKRGHTEKARQHYMAAAAAAERTQNLMVFSETLYKLARLDFSEKRFDDALKKIKRSIEMTERFYSDAANAGLKRSYISSAYDRFELLTDILMEGSSGSNARAREALLASERARSRSLLRALQISEADFTADADPGLLRIKKEIGITLNAKADSLTDLLAAASDTAQIEKVRSEIGLLEHRLGEINSKLQRESPMYSAVKAPPPFDLEEFQTSVLDEDTILLEYFLGDEESYLWVVTTNDLHAYVLPSRDVIAEKIGELGRLLEARQRVPGETVEDTRARVADADARYPRAARELSEMILGPAADKLVGKRIIVVPDGSLHHFPINALPLPGSGSDEPILLTNEVVYQPSAQTLSLLVKFRSASAEGRTRDLLVFSDPVFSRDDSRLSGIETISAESVSTAPRLRFAESLEGLQRLPSSGQEAIEIAGIVGSGATDIFTGFGATRDQLLTGKLSDYKIVHLATHALVDQERPELSAVVLSRFDEMGGHLDESVRLQDIYAMKLNADLVVLSACRTASGKEIKGEGVMGLNNAFLQAGARSVVASLWAVDDHASNMLMRRFYEGMADGLSVSSALRDAQLALYRDPQFRSPFFWAAFTLHGDMNRQPAIGTGVSAWWWLATVPALLLIGLLIQRRSFRKPS